MIYVTGDTHGDINRFCELNMPGESSWTNEDYLIICGDFGFVGMNKYKFKTDEDARIAADKVLDELSEKPYTILWVDGNHENFKELYEYPVELWNGGKIHRIRKNIFHLMRGQAFVIEGKKFFTMGGAYSIDRYMRKKDFSYWDEELPSNEEYKEATKTLKQNSMEFDYIITHTAPREIIMRMGYYPNPHDMEFTGFLEWIMYECKFKHWYFGHWHEDKAVTDKFTALLFDVIELN